MADATDWTDVLQAVASVAVLAWAVYQADEAARLRRGQYAAVVIATQTTIRAALSVIRTAAEKLAEGKWAPHDVGEMIMEAAALDHAEKELHAIAVAQLPTAMAMRQLIGARAVLAVSQATLRDLAAKKYVQDQPFDGSIEQLEKSIEKLAWQRVRLKKPYLTAVLDWRYRLTKKGKAPPDD